MTEIYHEPLGQVFYEYHNPEASAPLVIPITLVCNTSDEEILANVKENSADPGRFWVPVREPHGKGALIVGSGPSLADHIDTVRELATKCDVYALNGAAKYLADRGIACSQVIADARPQNITLIESRAEAHFFASQVNPMLFRAVPDARLFHVFCGEPMWKAIPEDRGDYAMIGGTSSVGCMAPCLLYAMGYRSLHCFGLDSSHRAQGSHAQHQALNDGEPLVDVDYRGMLYRTSFTMRAQATTWTLWGRELERLGCTITLHGDGLLPAIWNNRNEEATVESEKRKYEAMWTHPIYRRFSPGEALFDDIQAAFVELPHRARVIDFGMGPGRLSQKLAKTFDVVGVDIASNSRDPDVTVPVVIASLWDLPKSLHGDAGVCTDVMEHIPTEKVDAVLANISRAVPLCYFRIEFDQEQMGDLICEVLHLTCKPADWWLEKLSQFWNRVEAREGGIFIARS